MLTATKNASTERDKILKIKFFLFCFVNQSINAECTEFMLNIYTRSICEYFYSLNAVLTYTDSPLLFIWCTPRS